MDHAPSFRAISTTDTPCAALLFRTSSALRGILLPPAKTMPRFTYSLLTARMFGRGGAGGGRQCRSRGPAGGGGGLRPVGLRRPVHRHAYAGFGYSETERKYRLGWRLARPADTGAFTFSLEASRCETDNAPEHGIGFRLTTRW